KIEAALAGLDVLFLHNPAPAAGLSQSLRIGLDAVGDDADGAIILLADMPRVTAKIIDELLGAFDSAPAGTKAVIPVHAGRRGNPVLLGKDIFEAVREAKGDRGARSVLERLDQGILELPIDDPAIEIDIDTPEMLVRCRDSAR
ncbi:MAG: nucleotidyltransferase family protein, partial [Beijerinckiaceae bacterium]